MADDLAEKYPTLFYHNIANTEHIECMSEVRLAYLTLAGAVQVWCPDNRSRSLAMTYLEDSLMRAIQSIAVLDASGLIDPRTA
jgi:hypothetical protein